MSNPESFIEEVTEEVRRDKLFAFLKKYGWIGILGAVAIVAGTAANEWLKARDRAAAEAVGDAVLAAMDQSAPEARLSALDEISVTGDAATVLGLIEAAQGSEPKAAAEKLKAIATDPATPPLYAQLATLKRAMLPAGVVPAAERASELAPLTEPGAPFRVLAEEQIALAEVEQGEPEAAIARLQKLTNDTEASGALRRRARQLIVALGGTPEGGS